MVKAPVITPLSMCTASGAAQLMRRWNEKQRIVVEYLSCKVIVVAYKFITNEPSCRNKFKHNRIRDKSVVISRDLNFTMIYIATLM